MTSDFSTFSYTSSLDSHVHDLTIDGSSLPIASQGTLSTTCFFVPFVVHVPRFIMQLFFAGHLTGSSCCVILDVDSC